MASAMEPGAGTKSGVHWKHQTTRLPVLTLKLRLSIHPTPTPSLLSKSIINRLLTSCPTYRRMKSLIWQVILVGHSAGGLSLMYAIHRLANKIHMAIYVAAHMLRHGFVSDQDYKDTVYGLEADQPPTSTIIKEQFQRKILYHLSSKEDSTLAAMLLRPGPLRPFRGVHFTEGPESGADSVPRVFIKTMHD
ncbi:Methyl esterase 17-like protein isoform 2 [Theobroma cacao]|uniref:Methyl esterase 17-like protein isoform 2 n=1 Tax=Theobroma cacao TaxID=3641 RepID=A0A061H0F9_THECC|nr:Methyl esterase 17-like protein isoform 2 [Theobroma cacao]